MSAEIKKLFAKLLAIILGIVAVFSGGNAENIDLSVKNDVTVKTEIIELEVSNCSGRELTTGNYFTLEKNENGEWVKVAFSKDYMVEEDAVVIRNLQTVSFSVNVVRAFGKTLDAGEYRLGKTFTGRNIGAVDVGVTFVVGD